MDARAPDVVDLRFTLTRDDYRRWCEALQQDPENLKRIDVVRQHRIQCVAWLLGVPAVWAFFVWRSHEDLLNQETYAVFLMILIFAIGSYFMWYHWECLRTSTPQAIHQRQQADVMSERAQDLQGEYRVTISPAGVTLSRQHGTFTWDWVGIRQIDSSHEMIVIWTHSGSQLPIPHHALSGIATPEAFVQKCRDYHAPHAETYIREELVRLMAKHNYPCPGCRYQLRGVKETRCPECGRPIVPGEIRQHIHKEALKTLS